MYDAVLTAQKQVIEAIRPGVRMEDLHLMAARTMMEGLLGTGMVKGSLDDIMEANIFALFFPHGFKNMNHHCGCQDRNEQIQNRNRHTENDHRASQSQSEPIPLTQDNGRFRCQAAN